MKFGKQLEEQATPEWLSQFIDYRLLKKKIKKIKVKRQQILKGVAPIIKAVEAEVQSHHGTVDTGTDIRLVSFDDSSLPITSHLATLLPAELQNTIRYRKETQEFFVALDSEIDKVNKFFKEVEKSCCVKQAVLQRQTQIYIDRMKVPMMSHLLKFGNQKKQLLMAMQEHYRCLVLLQNYRIWNFTGFNKILKKYVKNSGNSQQIMDVLVTHISEEPFKSSPTIDTLMKQTEDLATKYIHNGNRKHAMNSLRVPRAFDESSQNEGVLFRCGTWFGISVFLTLAALYVYLHDFTRQFKTEPPLAEVTFFMFRLLLFPILLGIFIAVNVRIWDNSHINYVFIFELDPRKHLSKHAFLELSLLSYVVWISFLLFYLWTVVAEARSEIRLYNITWISPLVLLFLFIITLVFPHPKWFYGKSRMWFLKIIGRILIAPFAEVKFTDFWFADQLTSMSEFLFEVQFAFCIYPTNFVSPVKALCERSQILSLPVLNGWPFWARLMQCLRRYYDTKDTSHLVNAGKYGSALLVIIFAFLQKSIIKVYLPQYDKAALIIYFVMNVLSTIYKFSWDILRDWSLFQFSKDVRYKGLRSKLLFHPAWYYLAIMFNLVLRFLWAIIFLVRMLSTVKLDVQWFLFLTAFLEIIRRAVWNIFRLENEHLNNCGRFRAVQEIPLPFELDMQHVPNKQELTKKKEEKTLITKNPTLPFSVRIRGWYNKIKSWSKGQRNPTHHEEKEVFQLENVNHLDEDAISLNDHDTVLDVIDIISAASLSSSTTSGLTKRNNNDLRKSVSMPVSLNTGSCTTPSY